MIKPFLWVLVLVLLLTSCSEHFAKKQLENCADHKINLKSIERFKMIERENWQLKYMKLKEDPSIFWELYSRQVAWVEKEAKETDNQQMPFRKKPLNEKLQEGVYEKAFLNCEKLKNESEMTFKEKYKKPIPFLKINVEEITGVIKQE